MYFNGSLFDPLANAGVGALSYPPPLAPGVGAAAPYGVYGAGVYGSSSGNPLGVGADGGRASKRGVGASFVPLVPDQAGVLEVPAPPYGVLELAVNESNADELLFEENPCSAP